MNLRIEKAIYGGDGLARHEGKAIFVPGTLPGELVQATVTTDRRGFSSARLDAVVDASAERVTPGCEYAPRCGGCQYQHANPAFQLTMKLDILRETFARAHVAAPEHIVAIASPPWGYRNRVRLHVQHGVAGYRERGSHRLLPVTHCPIAAPLIEEAIAALGKTTLCEEIEFFSNGEELLLSLWPGEKQRVTRADFEAFVARIPGVTGAGLFLPKTVLTWGEPALLYRVGDTSYRVSLGSFFQVNRFLAPELLSLVTKERQGRLAWDLYAGVGLFARGLAFENVTAVESEGFSATDLRVNLPPGHRVHRTGTLEFLQSPAATKEKPELVVVDPPRAGLGKEVCGLLARVGAAEMVYVSCDPATLARDLQLLLQNGYGIEKVQLVDLFPQTFHMETVVHLKRN